MSNHKAQEVLDKKKEETKSKLTEGDDDKRHAEQMSRVVDGLRGDAFVTAKKIGFDKLWQVGDGIVNRTRR